MTSYLPKTLLFSLLAFNASMLAAAPSLTSEQERSIQETLTANASKPGAASFTPPANWFVTDPSSLPKSVLIMVIGKSSSSFPPSINLAKEHYPGTVKQYLKRIKMINQAQGYEWKDLGAIKTDGGDASLSQVDRKTQWGDVRMMHVIAKKNDNIYILTVASLKEEFPNFYKTFFDTMRSFHFNKSAHEMIANKEQHIQVENEEKKLKLLWKQLAVDIKKDNRSITTSELGERIFSSEKFQNEGWKPFQEILESHFSEMDLEWKNLLLEETRQKLEKQ